LRVKPLAGSNPAASATLTRPFAVLEIIVDGRQMDPTGPLVSFLVHESRAEADDDKAWLRVHAGS
jgi:hypothetical protein